jgi:hypothetical protein
VGALRRDGIDLSFVLRMRRDRRAMARASRYHVVGVKALWFPVPRRVSCANVSSKRRGRRVQISDWSQSEFLTEGTAIRISWMQTVLLLVG